MKFELGQEVYVPSPHGKSVRAIVIGHGGPDDQLEVVIDGKDVKRHVTVVRHEEGPSKGFVARVPDDLIFTEPPA